MANDRDLQSKIAVVKMQALAPIAGAGETLSATVLDILGYRNVTIIVDYEQATINAGDDMHLVAYESADLATWAAIPLKELPTRHVNTDGQLIFTPNAPYRQTVGLSCTQRYLRVGIDADTVGGGRHYDFWFYAIKEAENVDFVRYDPTAPTVPPDALP